jgi:ABC-type branched-subunit amino acid transport system ATPase component
MLEIKNLTVNYGAITALRGISLEVKQGEIVTLIGANGAGKTTTLRAISGLLKAAGARFFTRAGASPAGRRTDRGGWAFRMCRKAA